MYASIAGDVETSRVEVNGGGVDEDRFEDTWNAHCHALTRYCTFSAGSSHDGEELAAETFSRLLSSGRKVPPAKVEAWLFTVAHNLCASHHRRAARSRRLIGKLAEESSRITADEWSDPELWDAVRTLDERSRLVVYLRIFEDRSFTDVARIAGVSEGAAKMTYYRAMKRLRTLLGTRFEVGGVTDAE